MMIESIHEDVAPAGSHPFSSGACFIAGKEYAARFEIVKTERPQLNTLKKREREFYRVIENALCGKAPEGDDGRWVIENARLLRTAAKQTRNLESSLKGFPSLAKGTDLPTPRIHVVVNGFLDTVECVFSEDHLIEYLRGFQIVQELFMGELWAFRPALQVELLARIVDALNGLTTCPVKVLITCLRRAGEAEWREIFEEVDVVDAALLGDPLGAYGAMDYESRDMYRNAVAYLAKRSGKSEHMVADRAVQLAREAEKLYGTAGTAAARRRHVGFYLVDAGEESLRRVIGYRPTVMGWVRDLIRRYPEGFYLVGIEVLWFAIVYGLLAGLPSFTPAFVGFFLLLIPATQAAVDLVNNLVNYMLPPRSLPKMDFSEGLAEDCSTLVAVPSLLLSESQVHELVTDLEIRYLANTDRHLYFALVTDWPDSDGPMNDRDALVDLGAHLIEALNRRYGAGDHTPFYLLHRHRVFNESEGRWMGWERKRGKLLDLNRLLRGEDDSFPIKVGNTSVFPKIRYVITLDSDTQLPRDAALKLIGTIVHPLNQAVIDPETKMVVEGYGILQPRIGVSIQSASRTWLASIYSGETGFDIYTRAISDPYQDLFGEGIFTGKGIYDVDAFRETLEHRFPENTLLSHDLIEGAYARAGLASDIELIDDYPSHYSAYSRRKHRWMRGDWQIMRWVLDRVPDRDGSMIPNPVGLIARWKILDNLRRSLFDPATLILLLSGWFYLPGSPAFWTAVSCALLLISAYSGLLFALLRAPLGRPNFLPWLKDTMGTFVRANVMMLLHLVFLLQEAMVACDAIARSLARVFFTRRRMLEWETAGEAESVTRKRATSDLYLEWSPWIAVAIGGLLWWLNRGAVPVAAPILGLWLISGLISKWLNSSPRELAAGLGVADVELLRESALRMWRYYRDWSSDQTCWAIPDHVREDGVVADRLSPTNLGFLLNSRIAAVHFGYLTLEEFVELTKKSLEATARLAKHRGHVFNWYSTGNLEALEPRFVSTVDSGNLAACLWTLKQAALAFIRRQPATEVLWEGICDIARLIGSSGDATASGLRYRVLRVGTDWRGDLPGLETAAREFTDSATGEMAEWGRELVVRIEKIREYISSRFSDPVFAGLTEIAELADTLVSEMDFSFLYNQRKKVLCVGYDATADRIEPSTYDLLASESRIASFVAIAKGDVPQNAWFHLGRKHTLWGGESALLSWTGTMFEYLMPALWMRHYPDTLIQRSMQAAVRVQRRRMRREGIPWGVSESGCAGSGEGCEYGYSAFGIPELAMKSMDSLPRIVSPYSTFLALLVDAPSAIRNLRRMADLGWSGKYSFYEAADYVHGKPVLVRSWMAHHLGMSFLATCNLLFENCFQEYFHAEAHVMATELLLHERVPTAVVVDAETVPVRGRAWSTAAGLEPYPTR